MAEKTYVVTATRFGHMTNRVQVDKAAEEGRTVAPQVNYLEQGQTVELDPNHPLTEKALVSGAIEVPGASAEKRKAELQTEIDRLDAERARLEAEQAPEELKGQALNDALEARGLSTDGSADEKRARLAESIENQSA